MKLKCGENRVLFEIFKTIHQTIWINVQKLTPSFNDSVLLLWHQFVQNLFGTASQRPVFPVGNTWRLCMLYKVRYLDHSAICLMASIFPRCVSQGYGLKNVKVSVHTLHNLAIKGENIVRVLYTRSLNLINILDKFFNVCLLWSRV